MPARTGAPEAVRATDESAENLRVRLLGAFDVRAGEGRPALVESPRARSLLGFLVLRAGMAVPRQRLAFLLWPDSTEGQARTNLRKVLHTLRREVPELAAVLDVTPATLCWRSDPPAWVDVAAFESELGRAGAGDAAPEDVLAALRSAVGMYAGDLLEGCYDEWVIEARERLRDRYIDALRRLVAALVERGERGEAVRFGRELVRADPLQEDSWRLLMSAHAAGGDRAGAMRVYHECVSTLERELGVPPSAETTAAYATLTPRTAADDGSGGEPTPRPARLVGRDEQWNTLTQSWLAAEAGRPQLVLVTGEAGIGKTRLVDELVVWCSQRGALTAQARSYSTEGELAYAVTSSWLRADGFRPLLARAGASDVRELARLLPELDDGEPGPTTGLPTHAAEARRRLFDAVARLTRAAERPLLLVADDAPWCDTATLQLVHYLVRLEPPLPLLVVATARRDDLDDDHPLMAVTSELELVDRAAEVPLGRLARAETETLARDLAARDLDSLAVAALHGESEGNPLFVVEMLRAGWVGARTAEGPLPRKLHALIDARLRRLSGPTRAVLGVAATVGRGFSTDLLSAAAGAGDDTLVAALDELWRRGVIREHAGDTYDFTHGKLREVAYASLSPAARRRHHRAVAEALQRLHGGALDSVAGQVAAHSDRAGLTADAVSWYVRAARQAQRLHADAEAVQLLERARELLAQLPLDQRPPRELDVLTAFPPALVGVDGFASARLNEVQHRALEVAANLGVEPDPALLRSLVMSRLCARDFGAARDAAERLRRAAEEGDDEALALECDYLLGITAFWDARLLEARQCFERVVRRFDPARRGEHLVRFGHDPAVVCMGRLGNTLVFLGDDAGARRARDGAVTLACETGHPYSRDTAYGFATLAAIDLEDVDVVRGYAQALPSQDQKSRPVALFLEGVRGYLGTLDGDTDGGIRRIDDAIRAAGEVDLAPGWHACLRRMLVAAHEAAGDPARGLVAADAALAVDGSRLWEAQIRRVRAEFLAAAGHPPDAVARELSAAAAVAAEQGAVGLARRVAASRSRLGLA